MCNNKLNYPTYIKLSTEEITVPKKQKYRKKTPKNKAKVCLKIMVLTIGDYTIIKVVQATHHQGDVRYGTSRSI